jgi:hypothetical protein
MAGKFEIYTDKGGKYRFRLKAGNGEIIATGEASAVLMPRRGHNVRVWLKALGALMKDLECALGSSRSSYDTGYLPADLR